MGLVLAEEEPLFRGSWIDDMVKKGFVSGVETTYLTKDGREIPVSFTGSVMHDDKGNIGGIVCVAQNVTERRQAEEALRGLYDELYHLRTIRP